MTHPGGRRGGGAGHFRCALGALLIGAAPLAYGAAPLPAYNVDIGSASVSGLSSGAFMAVQLHVAYSGTFKAGAAIVAGGPFYCAQGSLATALGPCMAATSNSKPATSTLVSVTDNWARQGLIDSTTNLSGSKVYLYSGTIDSTVKQLVMDEANNYYRHYLPAANVFYKNTIASEHAMITDYYGNSCSTKASPYIDNCNFDLAGELLKWIYGPLNAKNDGTPGGSFVEFDQTEFIAGATSHGMAASGWLYVPASCAAGASCRLHVALHGCQQDPTKIRDQFYKDTGYNKWADSNDIIVLYPQTAPSSSGNPNGCWDWWGYDDPNYAKKGGRQMAAIEGMVERIASGYKALPAPDGVTATAVSDSSVSLAWNAVSGAAGYRIYRDGAEVTGGAIAATSFTDTGLASGTSYSYTVRAAGASGALSPPSAAVSARTTGHPPPLPAPQGLAVTGTTASSVSLAWNAVSGATGYDVYRDDAKVTAAPLGSASFTDTGLAPSTTYSYAVSTQNASGESARSAAVSATTRAAFTCSTATASNYAHVQAGRAHASMGYALANGSNQNMGLYNVFYVTTLAQTAPGYYVIGTCP